MTDGSRRIAGRRIGSPPGESDRLAQQEVNVRQALCFGRRPSVIVAWGNSPRRYTHVVFGIGCTAKRLNNAAQGSRGAATLGWLLYNAFGVKQLPACAVPKPYLCITTRETPLGGLSREWALANGHIHLYLPR